MTDAEPLWRRMMELTVAFAAQAKRQQSNALRGLGAGSPGPAWSWEMRLNMMVDGIEHADFTVDFF